MNLSPRALFPWILLAALVGVGSKTVATLWRQSRGSAEAQQKADDDRDPNRGVRLGKVPAMTLKSRPATTREEAEKILALIASFARIKSPDFGLSATLSGASFAPLGKTEFSSGLLTDHAIEPSQAMKELVHLGPKALPFLLKALEDATPTQLVMEHKTHFGGMWYSTELGGNPANKKEWAILAQDKGDPFTQKEGILTHTVTVGDACFVAIGQIVGRGYSAVRYQPTACIVINSPTHTFLLRTLVRQIWESNRPEQTLLDSLLLDYSTEGVFNGHSLDGWGMGSYLQCQAALRLLYYYPEESSALIAERLGKLDVSKESEQESHMQKAVKNGVRVVDFLKAVAWAPNSAVRAALAEIVKKTDDSEIFREALPALEAKDEPLALDRAKSFLAALPADERGPYGEGYHLLILLGERFPEAAKPVFAGYLKNASLQRIHTMCEVLRKTREEWAIELLSPLLEDHRELHWGYGVPGGSPLSNLPSRVCDEAALSIYAQNPELVFLVDGDRANLDRQIEDMKKKIAERKRK